MDYLDVGVGLLQLGLDLLGPGSDLLLVSGKDLHLSVVEVMIDVSFLPEDHVADFLLISLCNKF